MNKGDLINAIAKDAGITRGQATDALNSIITNCQKTLKKGGKLTLVGFGTFSANKRGARKGRNPQTGAEITIPARKVVKFKAGKELSASVR